MPGGPGLGWGDKRSVSPHRSGLEPTSEVPFRKRAGRATRKITPGVGKSTRVDAILGGLGWALRSLSVSSGRLSSRTC
jgi:hypothetical protein